MNEMWRMRERGAEYGSKVRLELWETHANIERHHRHLYTHAQMHSDAHSHHTAGSTHSIVSGVDTDLTT